MFYEFRHYDLSEKVWKSCGKNLKFSSHIHQSFEIMVVCQGSMEVTVDDKVSLLQEGEAALIFPNQIHSMVSRESRHMVCTFSPELIKAFATSVLGKVPVENRFRPSGYLLEALDGLREDATLTEKKGILYSLCAEFEKGAAYQERSVKDDKTLLYQIFKFIEQNFNQDCSLDRLAKETGYSYSYLSRYFKKIVHISFNEYVNQYRINNACYLLGNSENTVVQCALESGYESLRSFNRNFLAYMSVTPIEYRKSLKK